MKKYAAYFVVAGAAAASRIDGEWLIVASASWLVDAVANGPGAAPEPWSEHAETACSAAEES